MSSKTNNYGDYYYSPEGYIIFTEKYHKERGYCCNNGCKHCPYENINTNTNKINMKAIKDKIITNVMAYTESQTASGLILPESMAKKQYTVLSVGPDVDEISVGDEVFFNELNAVEIEHDREKFLVISEDYVEYIIG